MFDQILSVLTKAVLILGPVSFLVSASAGLLMFLSDRRQAREEQNDDLTSYNVANTEDGD